MNQIFSTRLLKKLFKIALTFFYYLLVLPSKGPLWLFLFRCDQSGDGSFGADLLYQLGSYLFLPHGFILLDVHWRSSHNNHLSSRNSFVSGLYLFLQVQYPLSLVNIKYKHFIIIGCGRLENAFYIAVDA